MSEPIRFERDNVDAKEIRMPNFSYRLSWSWRVDWDREAFARQLFRAWMRQRLPVSALQVRTRAPDEVGLVLEVEAPDLRSAVAQWSDFPYEAIRRQELAMPVQAAMAATVI